VELIIKVKFIGVSMKNILLLFIISFFISNNIYSQTYFSDDFEAGLGNWIVSGLDWGITDAARRSGNYSATDSPGGNYSPYADASMILNNALDLSKATFPVITFWHKYNTQYQTDFCLLDVSTDGGFSWRTINSWSGNTNGWVFEQIDLRSYKSPSFKFRFRLTSDGYTQYDGWYVDDVKISEFNNANPQLNFPFAEGFENGLGNWITSGSEWSLSSSLKRGGQYSVTCSPSGSYGDFLNATLVLGGVLDLTKVTFPVLTFWHRFNTPASDSCYLDVSMDGGFSWKTISNWHGTINNWTYEQIDLRNFKAQSFKLRYRLASNGNTQLNEWYIDDIRIYGFTANNEEETPPNVFYW
jgi:hypothetical protein